MIDLHCHMLPGIDDGARDIDVSLRMAEMAVADGITLTACTPHIYPGWFENTAEGIRAAVAQFQEQLEAAGIPLKITAGADIQVVPELVAGLRSGVLPTLHGSRYFLFEPPHHTSLPRLADLAHAAVLNGYIPIITHPERLTYIEQDYEVLVQAARNGAWIQLTGGSLLGNFGPLAQKYSQRFLEDGLVHLLASDGHNLDRRAPVLAQARDAAAAIVGIEEAQRLVQGRPEAVIADLEPDKEPMPHGLSSMAHPPKEGLPRSWLARLLGR
ncbi:MAG: CpsB/CapC family capsule biosynthesis tyrosine phosphatase [Halioglobus sp.]